MLYLRKLILQALRAYTHTSLRGCTRLTELLHSRLCPPGSPFVITLDLDGVPLELDLGEPLQTRMFYGLYESNEIAFLRRALRPGQVFVDAGANVGYYSAVAASIVGSSGVVHAFEPVPWLYERLSRLAEQAGMHGYRILPNQAALCDREGERVIWTSQTSIGWSTIVSELMSQKYVKDCYPVPCMRLDEYFSRSGWHPPDMVKIDVEGAELEVLRGSADLFEAGLQPTLLCEVIRQTAQDVIALLARFGYEPFQCLRDGSITRFTLPLPFSHTTLVFIPFQN